MQQNFLRSYPLSALSFQRLLNDLACKIVVARKYKEGEVIFDTSLEYRQMYKVDIVHIRALLMPYLNN